MRSFRLEKLSNAGPENGRMQSAVIANAPMTVPMMEAEIPRS